jgi:hypothetical protein
VPVCSTPQKGVCVCVCVCMHTGGQVHYLKF